MLEALDDLRPNEVYVATGGSFRYAFWGELMSTRARYLRAAGAVLNGFVRDAAGIEALGFPTFSRGLYAQDQGPRGKVIDFRVSIEIEGVRIAPGDLIFGDREGVLVIPFRGRGRGDRRRPSKKRRRRTGSRPPSGTAWGRAKRSRLSASCDPLTASLSRPNRREGPPRVELWTSREEEGRTRDGTAPSFPRGSCRSAPCGHWRGSQY